MTGSQIREMLVEKLLPALAQLNPGSIRADPLALAEAVIAITADLEDRGWATNAESLEIHSALIAVSKRILHLE
jgi:hypothetical protein